MKFKFIFLFAVTLSVFSCKNNKNSDVKKEEKRFKVSFSLVAPKLDTLQLFYTNDTAWNFKEELSIRQPIKGDSLPQIVSFELPDGYQPNYIRLDFMNKDQDLIKIENVKFELDSVVVIKDSLYTRYFSLNQSEIQDTLQNVLKIKKDSEFFDPFIFSTDPLKVKMNSVVK